MQSGQRSTAVCQSCITLPNHMTFTMVNILIKKQLYWLKFWPFDYRAINKYTTFL
jgi:hypothetical protein